MRTQMHLVIVHGLARRHLEGIKSTICLAGIVTKPFCALPDSATVDAGSVILYGVIEPIFIERPSRCPYDLSFPHLWKSSEARSCW